jgi:hypothetical protein
MYCLLIPHAQSHAHTLKDQRRVKVNKLYKAIESK